MTITVRAAERGELDRVNELRRMVNDVHVQGRPDRFTPGFGEALQNHLFEIYDEHPENVLVALVDDAVAGYALVQTIVRPETPYRPGDSFYHVQEFGVDERFRRMGVAAALVAHMKGEARALGLERIELDVWEFNHGAQRFYEAAGFRVYRRYLELPLD